MYILPSYNRKAVIISTALRKKESQNGSHRRAIWLSVTQLSLELHYEEKKRLSPPPGGSAPGVPYYRQQNSAPRGTVLVPFGTLF